MQVAISFRISSLEKCLVVHLQLLIVSKTIHDFYQRQVMRSWISSVNMRNLHDLKSYKIVSKKWRKLAKITSLSKRYEEVFMKLRESLSLQETLIRPSMYLGKRNFMDNEYLTVQPVMVIFINDSE